MLDSDVIDKGNGVLCVEIGEEEAIGLLDLNQSFITMVNDFIHVGGKKGIVFFKKCFDGKCVDIPIEQSKSIYGFPDEQEQKAHLCIDTSKLDTDASEVIQAGGLFSGNAVMFAQRVGKLFTHDKIKKVEKEAYGRK